MRPFAALLLCLLALGLPAFAQSLPEETAAAQFSVQPGQSGSPEDQTLSREPVLAPEDSASSQLVTMVYAGPSLSQEEIAALWRALPSSVQSIYNTRPEARAPYAIGQLSPDYLEGALAYLNLIRQLAGLEKVTLSDHLCVQAQYGAVLLAANDDLTHTPEKPADMDAPFFRMGANACAGSNLSMRYGFPMDQLLTSALQGHMDEDSAANRQDLGHRRWLLNPRLGQVGFGLAPAASGKQYIAVPVTDVSGRGSQLDQVLWPAAGNFPNQLFSPGTPWSVILSDQFYQTPLEEELAVTVTRLRDGKTFSLPLLDGTAQLSSEGSYLLVSRAAYGSGCCVSFSIGKSALGASRYWGDYQVSVTGLRTLDGTEAALEYTVRFFDAENLSYPSSWAESEVAEAAAYGLAPEDLLDFYGQPITRLEQCRLMMRLLREATGLSNKELAARYAFPDPPVFLDCDDPEVLAAAAIGAVRGNGEGLFLPGEPISRQDAAVLMYQTAGALPLQTLLPAGDLPFRDGQRIAAYARPAAAWAYALADGATGLSVMAGTGGGEFSPAGPFTREQALLSALRLFRSGIFPSPEP